jgi:hypothetical protein
LDVLALKYVVALHASCPFVFIGLQGHTVLVQTAVESVFIDGRGYTFSNPTPAPWIPCSHASLLAVAVQNNQAIQPKDLNVCVVCGYYSKSRAGMIQGLPAIDPAGGKRTMYLIPPTKTTAARLGVTWEPAECLLALVVPDGHSDAAGRR